jgi:hypothetical protein
MAHGGDVRPRAAAIVWALAATAAAQSAAPTAADVSGRLDRVGERVAAYYARARSVTSTETVWIQTLARDFSPVGFARRLVYELRIGWDPLGGGQASEAQVLRQLLTVNGRTPGPDDEAGCMDPRPVSPEALSLLLPQKRGGYTFTWAGETRLDGRESVMIDYRSVATDPPEIVWTDDCVSVELPGRTRGRLWVDTQTDDVLRLDEHLVGMFEFPVPFDRARGTGPRSMIIERADSSIRFHTVSFEDPDETIVLPRTIETLTFWRNAGVARVRTTQTFSDYRRFITEGRVVQP